MSNRKYAGLFSVVVAVCLSLSGQALAAFTAADAAKVEADAKATLASFKASTKGADEVLAKAKGVLVCPTITKGGFVFGYEGGTCVLTSGSDKPLYYGSSALKAGLLVGVEKYSMILALNTPEALAKFTSDAREWELGVDASVAVAKVGAGGAIDTTNLQKDIVAFIFGEKGLMGDVSFQGSRFKKLDVQ